MRQLTDEEKAECNFIPRRAQNSADELIGAFLFNSCSIQPSDFNTWIELWRWLQQLEDDEDENQDEA